MEESIVFDGKTYISSKRAAEMVGYTSDYVGQLCRAGKIDAKLVGRNWYVVESSIQAHRDQRLKRKGKSFTTNNEPTRQSVLSVHKIYKQEDFKGYKTEFDDRPLIPKPRKTGVQQNKSIIHRQNNGNGKDWKEFDTKNTGQGAGFKRSLGVFYRTVAISVLITILATALIVEDNITYIHQKTGREGIVIVSKIQFAQGGLEEIRALPVEYLKQGVVLVSNAIEGFKHLLSDE
jgi:hypothetical protein